MDNIQKDAFLLRKVLRELIILRKLFEMNGNLFTTKIIDIILPKDCHKNYYKMDVSSPIKEEIASSETNETIECTIASTTNDN